jgi:starch-binding outer membrane protein, SusD/RagB family
MRKKLIYCLIILLATISCSKDWLDKKPSQDVAVPTTLKDFQALLDNINLMNIDLTSISEVSTYGHYIANSIYSTLSENEKNAYTWSRQYSYTSVADYNNTYKAIFICNLVLDGLKNHLEMDQVADYENIKGQALFLRGKYYYELSQIYVPPYSESNKNAALGLNIRVESDVNIPVVRHTIDQTYNQIIEDLSSAESLLPMVAKVKTRGSKLAARGMLARIYLSMEKYSEALKYADSCLKDYSALMDYNTISIIPPVVYPIKLFNSEVIFHSQGIAYTSLLRNSNIVDTTFYKLYVPNDLRRTVFYDASNPTLIKFRGGYAERQQPFTGIATDEIFLIRSECNARLDSVQLAMNDLNKLLKTRWSNSVPYSDVTAASQSDALKKILVERKKELFMRGIIWSDLRRLNNDPQFQTSITRTVNGILYTLEPKSYKYTFPIPDDILQQTGFEQNPNW